MIELRIETAWDGQPIGPDEAVRLWLAVDDDGDLALQIDAPFHGDVPPDAPAGSLDGLWNHEVVECFLAGPDGRYTELEFGPHGHYLGLRFVGVRQRLDAGWGIDFVASAGRGRWKGQARVAKRWLPERPWRVAAFAIHGEDPRRFLAHPPLPGEKPDFHQPGRFSPWPG